MWLSNLGNGTMKDTNVVTLYKNKGDRGDCNNYHGISLLSIVGKLLARVVLKRLQVLADCKLTLRILPFFSMLISPLEMREGNSCTPSLVMCSCN